ncbi:hypothetical protein RFUL19S_02062 [Rhizobacter fulvus]
MLRPKSTMNLRLCRSSSVQRRRRLGWGGHPPHGLAIKRLQVALTTEIGLEARFHSGVDWCGLQRLLPDGGDHHVLRERPLMVGGRRCVPDLTVTNSDGKILLLVEVWHTHAVDDRKRQAFAAKNLPWIEVRCWHVIARQFGQPLPVLDWGGLWQPAPPAQSDLHCALDQPFAEAVQELTVFDVAAAWQRRLGARLGVVRRGGVAGARAKVSVR